jgi:hypothetical protein
MVYERFQSHHSDKPTVKLHTIATVCSFLVYYTNSMLNIEIQLVVLTHHFGIICGQFAMIVSNGVICSFVYNPIRMSTTSEIILEINVHPVAADSNRLLQDEH